MPLLEGFIDIHCHLLPGLDDGAQNRSDSQSMLNLYKQLGVVGIVATPHILKGVYPNTAESIGQSANAFKQLNHSELLLSYAAEHMLDEDFDFMLSEQNLLCLKENKVLIEMSYANIAPRLNLKLFNMQNQGYSPVLAHPERYQFYKSFDQYVDLKNRGCSFQLNLLSLGGHYGPEVKRKAELLLKKGQYDYAGTDAHHIGHLEKISQLKISSKLYPKLEQIINNNLEFK